MNDKELKPLKKSLKTTIEKMCDMKASPPDIHEMVDEVIAQYYADHETQDLPDAISTSSLFKG